MPQYLKKKKKKKSERNESLNHTSLFLSAQEKRNLAFLTSIKMMTSCDIEFVSGRWASAPMNQPDLEPALSKSFKTTSHGFSSRNPGIDGHVFVSSVPETRVNWCEGTVNWTEKHHLTSSCSSLSSSPGELGEAGERSWALRGHAIIPFDNILNGFCCFFFSLQLLVRRAEVGEVWGLM